MMNRKRAFLPVLHSCFIFLILVLLFPNLAYSFPADFDGDGKNDFVVWRQPEANWYVWPSTYSVSHSCPPHFQQISGTSYLGCVAQWGLPGDYVLSGSYDQDAKADLVIWRPSTQTWWIKFSSYDGAVSVPMGLPGDIPDEFNADKSDSVSDLVLWRDAERKWYVRSSIYPNYTITPFKGGPKPSTQVAPAFLVSALYYRAPNNVPSGPAIYENFDFGSEAHPLPYGQWLIVNSELKDGPLLATIAKPTAHLTDTIAVGGNFRGDYQADYVFWDRVTGNWTIFTRGGSATPTVTQWGLSIDTPLAGDFDGDGVDDMTVWRGSSSWAGTWFILPSSHVCPAYMTPYGNTGGCYKQWGLPGDIPVS